MGGAGRDGTLQPFLCFKKTPVMKRLACRLVGSDGSLDPAPSEEATCQDCGGGSRVDINPHTAAISVA